MLTTDEVIKFLEENVDNAKRAYENKDTPSNTDVDGFAYLSLSVCLNLARKIKVIENTLEAE